MAGGNYGNPVVEVRPARFIDPVWETRRWSDRPSGATFYTGTAMPEYTRRLFLLLVQHGDMTRMPLRRAELRSDRGPRSAQRICYLDIANAPDGSLYVAGPTTIVFGR